MRYKILLPTSILIILVCAIMGINSYNRISTGLVEMGVEEAQMAVNIASAVVEGDLVKEIVPGSEDSEAYQTMLATMRSMKEDCGIAYLYTLYTDGSHVYYGVDTDETEEQSAVGDVFEVSYDELQAVFTGEPYIQDYIDDSNLITAYVPITDSTGTVVGIIGCDYDATTVTVRLQDTLTSVVGLAVVCLVVALLLINLIVTGIMRSLGAVNAKIYDLVHNEGDLTQKLDVTSGDELELIANNVNALLEYIRGIMLNIAGNSLRLNDSSRTVVENLSSAEVNISDVSATMEEMSAAMEETSASLGQINESISQIYDAIDEINIKASDGKEFSDGMKDNAVTVGENAVASQEEVKSQVEGMALSLTDKIEKSKAVEKISTLTANIISITDQTNLLALNASIEAARAGEAGKGFAVVADEIGKLATNSAEAAAEIRKVSADVIDAVNDLAGEAETMIQFIDETAMKGYSKLVESSGDYQSNASSMNDLMQDFAAASEQLKNGMDSIREAVEAVNIAVEESAKGVTNVTEMSVDLTGSVCDIESEANSNMDIANVLNGEVNKFKLE